MSNIYVTRKITPEELLNCVDKQIIILQSDDESGLSYFLKKTAKVFNEENLTTFYITGPESIAKQIFRQIFNSVSIVEVEKKLTPFPKKDVILAVLKSVIYPLDTLPFIPNIGSSLVNIIDCINSTINVDSIHFEDYKLELALLKYLEEINPKVTLVVDNPDEKQIDFFKILMKRNINLILSFTSDNNLSREKFLSKAEIHNGYPFKKKFLRPDKDEIKQFFLAYNSDIANFNLSEIERSNHSIHAIMTCINQLNFERDLSETKIVILATLKKIECPLSFELLTAIIRNYYKKSDTIISDKLNLINDLHDLERESIIKFVPDTGEVFLLHPTTIPNQSLINDTLLETSIIDTIVREDCLCTELCYYGIRHTSKQISKKKFFLLELLKQEKEKIETDYLLQLLLCDLEELSQVLTVGRLLYNRFYFKETFDLVRKYDIYQHSRSYQLLKALVAERLHSHEHIPLLLNLINSSSSDDEKCLLLSNLFVAFINKNDYKNYNKILNKSGQFYYKKFIHSQHYKYLLRNVAYYLPFKEGLKSYLEVLELFKGTDDINYKRTLSNFICFLMDNYKQSDAKIYLKGLQEEITEILILRDVKYEYLNNNFALYLMNFTNKNPVSYFNAISKDESGSETPYIYAKINLSLYYTKVSSSFAQEEFSEAMKLVQNSPVYQTKRFFAINQLLYLYINDIDISKELENLDTTPFRNNSFDVYELAMNYYQKVEKRTNYSEDNWDSLFCPGYLFYRYYDIKLLFKDDLMF
ncbi:hypothetical protein [Lactococcus lactis]|uniref:hypothetical protein n=1 Tax=Lactococcus lactis TaxID=1358 RepID=UPI0024A800A1|nr:hypothetical protein [Lactococcus lactis]